MKSTKKLVFMALLTAISLGIWILEAQLPPLIPVPGVKPGLASVVTLIAMALLGRREALAILLMRVVLSCLFAGSFSAILFSMSGGLVSWAVMALTVGLLEEKLLWAVSVLGALGHNAGQLLAAVAVTKTPGLLWSYGPILVIAAVATGALTGVTALYLRRVLQSQIKF